MTLQLKLLNRKKFLLLKFVCTIFIHQSGIKKEEALLSETDRWKLSFAKFWPFP